MIAYEIGTSATTIKLSDRVLQHFETHRQRRWYHSEAGGQLFARFAEGSVNVVEATGPRNTDQRGRTYYRPDRNAEQREIDEMFKRGLHFVGDWHTHPENFPTPSPSDKLSIAETLAKSRHALNGLLLVIVGKASAPEGMHVSIASEGSLIELTARGRQPRPKRVVRWI